MTTTDNTRDGAEGLVERLSGSASALNVDESGWLVRHSDYAALEAENARLRAVISECAKSLGNGAHVSTACSIEFMEELPKEISIVVARLRERIAVMDAALADASNFIDRVSGAAMGIAMSGSNHPDPDGVLMDFSREGMNLSAATRAARAARTNGGSDGE